MSICQGTRKNQKKKIHCLNVSTRRNSQPETAAAAGVDDGRSISSKKVVRGQGKNTLVRIPMVKPILWPIIIRWSFQRLKNYLHLYNVILYTDLKKKNILIQLGTRIKIQVRRSVILLMAHPRRFNEHKSCLHTLQNDINAIIRRHVEEFTIYRYCYANKLYKFARTSYTQITNVRNCLTFGYRVSIWFLFDFTHYHKHAPEFDKKKK